VIAETCAKLRMVTVATLTTILYKRGFRNQFLEDVGPLNAHAASMAGPAFTVRTIPAREDKATPEILGDRSYPQRAAIEDCPAGHVLVVDSRQDARAASGGDILMARLQARNVAGCVTDGGMRDCPAIADLGFPVYQVKPSPPISLLHHISVDMNIPIACGGVGIWPGDIIVGDQEGVIVVPAEIAADVADEAIAMTEYEDFVLDEVKGGASIFGLYPRNPDAEPKFEAWRAKQSK
ncbi:MAG: ribonuclease activity regulator RraA, partial [Pseudomonadota bacterium]